MERKEDTARRITRRKYEEKNKEKRKQASGNFGTMIPRALFNEINEFLEENDITKVRLIKEGYEALKKKKEKPGKYWIELKKNQLKESSHIRNQMK